MTIAEFIATFFGGGLLIFIIQEFRKSGKLELNSWTVKLNYSGNNGVNTFNSVELELLFINTSEYSKIFKSFSAEFFDGHKAHELVFDEYKVKPAFVIQSKKTTHIKLLLHTKPHGFFNFQIIDLIDTPTYLKLSFDNSKGMTDYKFYLSDMELYQMPEMAWI